jgi:predicted membrane-bound spermidine synthase
VISTTTLLASFLICLAIGYSIFGKLADRKINLTLLLAMLLSILSLFLLIHPFLFQKVISFYQYLNRHFDLGPYSVEFIRGVLSFGYFLIPVSIMGGIMPLTGKMALRNMSSLGRTFGIVFGSYMFGFLTASMLSGWILIPALGLRNSMLVAACMALITALVLIVMMAWGGKGAFRFHKRRPPSLTQTDEFVTIAAGKWKRRMLWIFGTTSFTCMSYRIVWNRMIFEISADKTVYFSIAFSISLFIGIAFGGFIVSLFADRIRKKFLMLAVIQILLAITSAGMIGLFLELIPLLSKSDPLMHSWFFLLIRKTGILLMLLLLPFSLLGFMFPLVIRMYAEELKTIGRKIGFLGLIGTTGLVLASFMVTFILIPLLGTYWAFLTNALLNMALGLFILLRYRRIKLLTRTWISITGMLLYVAIAFIFSEAKMNSAFRRATGEDVTETRREGSTASVEVDKTETGNIVLYINGEKAVSSDPLELRTDKLLANLPYMARPEAARVYILGLGIGITAKSMADMDVPDIEIVEISPEVTRVAADAYAWVNDNILAHENISIMIEDGRSNLFRSKNRYDIIICNAAHPRMNNALYTAEFYALCSEKLEPGGYLCQWMPYSGLSEDDFRAILKACAGAFSKISLWYAAPGQALLMASHESLRFDYCQSNLLFERMNRLELLTASGITGTDMILGSLLADAENIKDYAMDARANTDDRPMVEFSRMRFSETDTALLKKLSSFSPSYAGLIWVENCGMTIQDAEDAITGMREEIRDQLR